MRKDIQDATVRLRPDAAYDTASPEVARKGTVIVPRSDDAGRQDGRIPPGVAAELGLVPKLHEVGKDMAYLSRKQAAESGKSGDELYADFYARHDTAPSPQPGGRPALTAEDKLRLLTDAGYTVTADGRVIPPQARPHPAAEDAAGQRRQATRATRATRAAQHEKELRKAAAKPDRGRKTGAVRPPVRVFPAETGDDRADTLDGFYDELQGSGLGTDEVPRSPENGARGGAGGLPEAPAPRVRELPRGPVETWHAARPEEATGIHPDQPAPDPDGDAVFEMARRFARERDEARAAYDELKADYLALLQQEAGAKDADAEGLARRNAELQEENDRLQDLKRNYTELSESYKVADFKLRQKTAEVDLLRKSVSPVSEQTSDTVRVQLGAEPDLLTVVGRDADGREWKAPLLGHLDFSRTRGECVLSVIDPKYAAELLATLRPGEIRIACADGSGTACAYSGICDKIYGDPASADYITLFRFRVTGGASGS